MKEYEDEIHEMEKIVATFNIYGLDTARKATLELISLRRVLWKALNDILDSRYQDGCPDPILTMNCESEVNQYLFDRFGEKDQDDF